MRGKPGVYIWAPNAGSLSCYEDSERAASRSRRISTSYLKGGGVSRGKGDMVSSKNHNVLLIFKVILRSRSLALRLLPDREVQKTRRKPRVK
jgi:hypothetical protein